jgi:MYXO-CTERM domain-containing protein
MNRSGIVAMAVALCAPSAAHAFCGFYINGAGSEMFNNATQVVLMRQGTRTVLSMQNNYQGPPSDFAMVIPVPVVLHEADVKTLPKAVFAKVDTMGAPRLVEYWEQDPCGHDGEEESVSFASRNMAPSAAPSARRDAGDYGVTVEAKFDVGEYQIVILSAKDSTGLDRYLRDQRYQIPRGAEPLLRPYVEGGSKFFVAKVNPQKVAFVDGQAQLSPLRFHYDSEEFSLPIRLGLANSAGTQDLIVNILSPGQRYEVANYKNATIPTNLDVKDEVRTRFGEFYAALFDRTLQQHPGAIVTEYSWDAGTCDPCPGPTLGGSDFLTLGADVINGQPAGPTPRPTPATGTMRRPIRRGSFGYVLTRLHARYGKDGAPNDLVFRAAPPIVGGRELRGGADGQLEHGAQPSGTNNFQGRYAIRHAWTGPVACEAPVRGRWGGPPPGAQIASPGTRPAINLAFAPRGKVQLPNLVAQDIPELDVQQGVPLPAGAATPAPGSPPAPVPGGASFQQKPQGCGCQAGGSSPSQALLAASVLVLALARRRRARTG